MSRYVGSESPVPLSAAQASMSMLVWSVRSGIVARDSAIRRPRTCSARESSTARVSPRAVPAAPARNLPPGSASEVKRRASGPGIPRPRAGPGRPGGSGPTDWRRVGSGPRRGRPPRCRGRRSQCGRRGACRRATRASARRAARSACMPCWPSRQQGLLEGVLAAVECRSPRRIAGSSRTPRRPAAAVAAARRPATLGDPWPG